jgi:trans-aconitate 2-methyltransferase
MSYWDAALYDGKHSFVWKHGVAVLELLAPQPEERILDLGCGTGHLTARIAASGAKVVGADNAEGMIEQARAAYPELRFEIADGTALPYVSEFDAVFSNAAIHWMRPPEKVVSGIWSALRPGGRFVAEFGGKGNVGAIMSAVLQVLEEVSAPASARELRYYPSVGEYASLLEHQGFTVTYAALIDRPTPLGGGEEGMRNWLAMFGANLLDWLPKGERAAVVRRIEGLLRPRLFRDGVWVADYKRLRIVAATPGG